MTNLALLNALTHNAKRVLNAQPKELKVKSMKKAMAMLEDVMEYLTNENGSNK